MLSGTDGIVAMDVIFDIIDELHQNDSLQVFSFILHIDWRK